MHASARIALIALACLASVAEASASEAAALPNWLAGHWCSISANPKIEEHWLPAAGGLMLGVSRTLASGSKTQFEFMRIELVEGLPTLIAQPQGVAGTAFTQSAAGDDWVQFENAAHDFPNRVEYRRQSDGLSASIVGLGNDGKAMTIPFVFKRCEG